MIDILAEARAQRLPLDEFECPTPIFLPVGAQEQRRVELLVVKAVGEIILVADEDDFVGLFQQGRHDLPRNFRPLPLVGRGERLVEENQARWE